MKTDTEILDIKKVKDSSPHQYIDHSKQSLRADVSECWVANVMVTESVCRELVTIPWLDPEKTEAGYMMSFCTRFIRQTKDESPQATKESVDWLSELCIGCRDTRTGEIVKWVGHQYCDHDSKGKWPDRIFPQIAPCLEIELGRDLYDHRQLNVQTRDNLFSLRLVEYTDVRRVKDKAFESSDHFGRLFGGSVRCYSPGLGSGKATIVDLRKKGTQWSEMERYFGYLKTAYGNWPVASVYRSRNEVYEWREKGEVIDTSD
ncbi:MAG: hypothetical protein AAF546_00315 [Verrucomicrobiota bacterium]